MPGAREPHPAVLEWRRSEMALSENERAVLAAEADELLMSEIDWERDGRV